MSHFEAECGSVIGSVDEPTEIVSAAFGLREPFAGIASQRALARRRM